MPRSSDRITVAHSAVDSRWQTIVPTLIVLQPMSYRLIWTGWPFALTEFDSGVESREAPDDRSCDRF